MADNVGHSGTHNYTLIREHFRHQHQHRALSWPAPGNTAFDQTGGLAKILKAACQLWSQFHVYYCSVLCFLQGGGLVGAFFGYSGPSRWFGDSSNNNRHFSKPRITFIMRHCTGPCSPHLLGVKTKCWQWAAPRKKPLVSSVRGDHQLLPWLPVFTAWLWLTSTLHPASPSPDLT